MAIVTLHEAGRMLAPTDPDAASELTRKALALTKDRDPRRGPLVAETAVLLHAAGRDREAMEFAASALSLVLPPEQEAEVRLSIAQMFSLRADVRVESGQLALGLPDVSSKLRARHSAVLVLSLVAAARPDEARTALLDAEAAVRSTGDVSARLNLEFAKLALDEATYRYASMLPRIQTIRRLGDEAGEYAPVLAAEWFRSNLLAALDRLDEALEVATAGLAAAQRDRQGWIAPRWEIWQGWLLLQQGRVSDAGAVLEGALAAEGIVLAMAIPDAAGVLALGRVAMHTGNDRLAQKCAEIARATLAMGAHDNARRHLVWLLALQAMARDEAPLARSEFAALGDDAGTSVLPVLARDVGNEPQLVRLALAAQDKALAQAAVNDADERARLNPSVASIVATAAHSRGLLGGDLDELTTAVGLLEGAPRPLALASALEDLGRLLVKHDRNEEGIKTFGRALEVYSTAGATWDSRRVRGRLGRLGVRRRLVTAARPDRGWEALTDSELEVGRLIAQGLTNRGAAERLHVSPHTIGAHLRHIFSKLGINSRFELTRIVSEHDHGA
jgi:DNA-binding CsgD family transcriptional regulator/tetratricopeptide (TPR) repeat protein